MSTQFISEPDLEFASGCHIDMRFGLTNYGPSDYGKSATGGVVRLGIVGTTESIDGLRRWLERCSAGIAAKDSRLGNLFPAFPGFGPSSALGCDFVCDDNARRTIPMAAIRRLSGAADHNTMVKDAVKLFVDELNELATNSSATVLICAPPVELFDLVDPGVFVPTLEEDSDEEPEDPEFTTGRYVFHNLLKAESLALKRPIQLVRPRTYNGLASKSQRKKKSRDPRLLQDEATRAWNFLTALYYKAGGVPWRLTRNTNDLATCFIGVSFYRSLDETTVLTSLAQVFNERGDGVIVRGGPARVEKDDRTPHLSGQDAKRVIADTLKLYRAEHKTLPARVVVHKSSEFSAEESAGIQEAIAGEDIEYMDLLSIRRSLTRLYRRGVYPPLRGTLLSIEDRRHILYTRGSVSFFEAYPGMYVPRPLNSRP